MMTTRDRRWGIGVALGLVAPCALGAIKVDGRLDEPEWQRAQVFTDFRVTQPYTLGTPRHPTEVRLLGTPEGIIVGFHCVHPASTPRQKEQTPRDIDNNGDRVNVYIDLDADAKVAYNVTIALAGSYQDATITNENVYSTDWDGDIAYAVLDQRDDWYVEMLLPWTLASMKHPETPKRTIGVVFDRVIGQTQERSALEGKSFSRPRYLSEFPRVEIDQYQASLFHVFPYVTVSNDRATDESDIKFGADFLWKPSGSFQLTAALNPDFGQVEADELVVNFNAIEVLFSDKRPFFAENQALFDVRVVGDDRLIYTRRVGGPRDDDPTRAAEIDGAVKFNGTVGQLDFGLLSAVEHDYGDDIGRAFAAPRLRYTFGDWNVGYLGAWTDRPFLDRNARVHSSDFIWRPDPRLSLQGQVIVSLIDEAGLDRTGDGAVLQASYAPSPDWQHQSSLTHYSGDLDFNDLGFQERPSVNRVFYSVSRRFRDFAESDRRAGALWRLETEGNWNDSGDRLAHYLGLFREAQQRSGATLNSTLELTGEGVDDLISRGNGNVNVDARLLALEQTYQSARFGKWRAYGRVTLLQEGNDDYAFEAESKTEYFPRDNLNAALRVVLHWSRDWLIWQEDNLLASFHRKQGIVGLDLNWFPALNQELRLKFQWLGIDAWDATPYRIAPSRDLVESADVVPDFQVNNLGLQIRYRWTFAPQSDFYVVYGRGGITFEDDPAEHGLDHLFSSAFNLRNSDQLLVKARYRF
jgi:Domain of unknown function (DUF5916)